MASSSGWHSGGFSRSSRSSHRPSFSFLFVVNKLKYTANNPYPPDADRWGNMLPPYDRRAYYRETASSVMRYQDGRVNVADGHVWHRPEGFHTPGYVFGSSQPGARQPTPYKVQTVFSCNPFLPIIAAPDDMTTCDIDRLDGPQWGLLRFRHGGVKRPGVSFATRGQDGPFQYVAGSNPLWIPSLVPQSYLTPCDAPASQGLGGDLPLILGLMSFWPPWNIEHEARMEQVFYGRHALWRDHFWRGDPRYGPKGHSKASDMPRGLLVQVSLDDVYNPEGSTVEAMQAFEESVIVNDNSAWD